MAPMRSLFQERAALFRDKPLSAGKAVLVFGNRKRNSDFFYEDGWARLGVQVIEAWSREGREKVYVQDKVRGNPGLVWACVGPEGGVARLGGGEEGGEGDGDRDGGLNGIRDIKEVRGGGGTLFICGSSGKMPLGVRAAVIAAFVACGLSDAGAEAHLKSMEKGGRLVQETW